MINSIDSYHDKDELVDLYFQEIQEREITDSDMPVNDHIGQIFDDQNFYNTSQNILQNAMASTGLTVEPPLQQMRRDPLIVATVQRPDEWDGINPTLRTDLPNPGPEPRIVYPDHPKKANGISYLTPEGKLYATHRMKSDLKMQFGLENFVQENDPNAMLGVYLSMPGVHKKITNCAKHAHDYKTTEMMKLYFKGIEQTAEVKINGFDISVSPITSTIGDNNDRTYEIQFSCYTSCSCKANRGKELSLNFVLCSGGNITFKHIVPLFVSANPGRDSQIFKTKKRKSDESMGSTLPVKREAPEDPNQFFDETPYLSPAVLQMIEDQLPRNMPESDRRRFKLNQNALVMAQIRTNIQFANDHA
jgi:hypothetical protein